MQASWAAPTALCSPIAVCQVAVLLQAFTENTEHVAAFLEYLRCVEREMAASLDDGIVMHFLPCNRQPSSLDAIRDGFFCRVFHTVARRWTTTCMSIAPLHSCILFTSVQSARPR